MIYIMRRSDGLSAVDSRVPDVSDVTAEELDRIIGSLSTRKAPGIDLITASIIKRVWGFARWEVTVLMQKCISEGHFPSCWKAGLLRVIPKGNDKPRSDAKAYRPITLLPILGKVLEVLVRDRLESSLSPQSDRQFGFTRGKSTEDAILFAKILDSRF